MAGPGNEIECELLTWTHPEQQYYAATSYGGGTASLAGGLGAGGEALKWARVVWRRGTVPIWWGVQLQSLAQVGGAPRGVAVLICPVCCSQPALFSLLPPGYSAGRAALCP